MRAATTASRSSRPGFFARADDPIKRRRSAAISARASDPGFAAVHRRASRRTTVGTEGHRAFGRIAVTTLPVLSHCASTSLPAPEPLAIALQLPAAPAAAVTSAPLLALAFATPPSSAKAAASLPSPLESLFAFPPPPPSTLENAIAVASFADATASPPAAEVISAVASAPPVAVKSLSLRWLLQPQPLLGCLRLGGRLGCAACRLRTCHRVLSLRDRVSVGVGISPGVAKACHPTRKLSSAAVN